MFPSKKLILIFLLIACYLIIFSLIIFWPKIFYPASVPKNSLSVPFSEPWKRYNDSYLRLNAKAALSIEYENGIYHFLYQKNPDIQLPIASLTKLLTAWITVNKYSLDTKIIFSEEAVMVPEITGMFKSKEEFFLKDVLYSTLIESSNDAAWAISEIDGNDNFINTMNENAQVIGMKNSWFYDPAGLDNNISTAKDIFILIKTILESEKKEDILNILGTKEFNIYTKSGVFHHQAISTNKMLFDLNTTVIAGKTGSSPVAKECLMIISKHPKYQNGYMVHILLGSENRYEDMDNLVNWVNNNYIRL